MMKPPPLTFHPLSSQPSLLHGFSLRNPDLPLSSTPDTILPLLEIPIGQTVQAEQPHGDQVARVGRTDQATIVSGVDALITNTPGVILIIRTADCAPVYLWDPQHQAIALIHSGKKGTQANITGKTIESLNHHFDSKPEQLVAVIGPCIRPPHYEMDIAAEIQSQLNHHGVQDCFDCGENTASNLSRFYSYRKEKGKTGRHYAFLSLTA